MAGDHARGPVAEPFTGDHRGSLHAAVHVWLVITADGPSRRGPEVITADHCTLPLHVWLVITQPGLGQSRSRVITADHGTPETHGW